MNENIPAITVVKRGCDKFPRFIVAKGDAYKNPVFWDGSDWTANESEARIFANVTEASWVYHDAMMESLQDRPVHRFVAPLYIELHGEKPKLEDLRKWLEKAVRVVVNSPDHGLGPEESVAMMILDAEETKGE
ncbi:hypothetical protein [Bremerella sp. P1]|uniref:hypothetical protein n=1 Tax=Bremerella sp. P1 TaxID=3026424 RepID=UPI0023685CE3|nr:hypothetical protein [Bremerella sp. P1]WDI39881.1 hypothetical protein PSR63_15450 [Bremerella sp. P1]